LLHPTIFAAKLVTQINDLEHGVILFTDIHGHSRKKNVFLYGCTCVNGEKNPNKGNALIKAFPFLLT